MLTAASLLNDLYGLSLSMCLVSQFISLTLDWPGNLSEFWKIGELCKCCPVLKMIRSKGKLELVLRSFITLLYYFSSLLPGKLKSKAALSLWRHGSFPHLSSKLVCLEGTVKNSLGFISKQNCGYELTVWHSCLFWSKTSLLQYAINMSGSSIMAATDVAILCPLVTDCGSLWSGEPFSEVALHLPILWMNRRERNHPGA